MRIVVSKATGKKLCLDCKREDCNCLPEGEAKKPEEYEKFWSDLKIHKIKYSSKDATFFVFKHNILPNGKKIKIWSEIWIPEKDYLPGLRENYIKVNNKFLNKLTF